MTLASLLACWVVLASVVCQPRSFLTKLGPLAQAIVGFSASLTLVLIPVSAAVVALSGALSETGGLSLRGCGRLVWAVLAQPMARPGLSFALVFLAIVPFGLARGAASAWRSQTACRKLAGDGQGPLVIASASTPFAFTTGFLRPRVVVSRGLLADAPPAFRDVVLAHEEAHRIGRHPLLLFVSETMARALPLAPLRWASETLRFGLESLADDRAVRETNDRELVAETVAGLALSTVGVAPSFEGDEVRRVRRLLTTGRSYRLRGAAVVAALFGVLLFAGGHGAHCAAESLDLLATAQCRLH